ncbi:DNA replication endonuclease-helicase Dna2 [Dimargaris xerosporica]|nr:DNA replication endonuclease-helicase Dna2 [Dimargaris xerosporica]
MSPQPGPNTRSNDRVRWLTSPPAKTLQKAQPGPVQDDKRRSPTPLHEEEITEIVQLIGQPDQPIEPPTASRVDRPVFTEETLKQFRFESLAKPTPPLSPGSPTLRMRLRRAHSHGVIANPALLPSGSCARQLISELMSTLQPTAATGTTLPLPVQQKGSCLPSSTSSTESFEAVSTKRKYQDLANLPPIATHPTVGRQGKTLDDQPIKLFKRSVSSPQPKQRTVQVVTTAAEPDHLSTAYQPSPPAVTPAQPRNAITISPTAKPTNPSPGPTAATDDVFDLDDIEELLAVTSYHESQAKLTNALHSSTTSNLSTSITIATEPQSKPQADAGPTIASDQATFTKRYTYERYLVLQVTAQSYTTESIQPNALRTTYRYPEKVLKLFSERHGLEKFAYLREDWYNTAVEVGDYVHIVGDYALPTSIRVIDNAHGFAIVHPDCLISCTHLANAFTCLRRSVLQDRVRDPTDINVAMVHGLLMHDLLEAAIRINDFSPEFFEADILRVVTLHTQDLFLVGETEDKAIAYLKEWSPILRQWADTYIGPEPKPAAVVQGHRQPNGNAGQGTRLPTIAIQKVLDIEENIWSPMFGLKGKIDVSVQVALSDPLATTATNTILALPLEFKTSASSRVMTHRAQVTLYTLLMTDRYDIPIENGLLYYIKTNETILVPAFRDEIRGLMVTRNEMATYIVSRRRLPSMLQNLRMCKMCPVVDTCVLYHRSLELGTAESSGLGALFDTKTAGLTVHHLAFFERWEQLINAEEKDMSRFRKEIWCMLAKEREQMGRCWSDMMIVQAEAASDNNPSTIDRIRYRCRQVITMPPPNQRGDAKDPTEASLFLNSMINVGDPVVVSSQLGHYSLATGFVLEVNPGDVLLSLDRPLRGFPRRVAPFDPIKQQQFAGIMETHAEQRSLGPGHHFTSTVLTTVSEPALVSPNASLNGSVKLEHSHYKGFRVDKDELTAGMATVRYNLVALFTERGDHKRRRLVVDLEAPRFARAPLKVTTLGPRSVLVDCTRATPTNANRSSQALAGLRSETGTDEPCQPTIPPTMQAEFAQLNVDQRHAVEKVLNAEDYALILGMPGTGKTTTIAFIVKILVACRKTVLLTSYTHTAVDNILLKLRHLDINLMRLGNKTKVHPDIHPYVADSSRFQTAKQVEEFYTAAAVVGTTCLGINHPLFLKKRFDYCIVDEASQITLPVCIGPLRFADTFILVGDHYQLPPLVMTNEARLNGLAVSLFKQLSEAHPESVVKLEHQYRMNAEIMRLSNHLIYDHRLRCGTLQVAEWTLKVPQLHRLEGLHPKAVPAAAMAVSCSGTGQCWLQQTLDPNQPLLFLNTDPIPAHEVRKDGLVHNPIEARLVFQVVEALLYCGVPEDAMGIIVPYKAQLKLLHSQLGHHPQLEVHTVDKYQGRDKDCILMSFVRSNFRQNVGELLKDWRRINVALTRSKKKLILIGSQNTLAKTPLFTELIQLLTERKCILPLPPMAHARHVFPHLEALDDQDAHALASQISQPKPSAGVHYTTPNNQLAATGRAIVQSHPILDNLTAAMEL